MNHCYDIRPDWCKQFRAEELDCEGIRDHKFTGPGWYSGPSDTMLVVALERSIETCWNQKAPSSDPENELFIVYGWYHTNVHKTLELILGAPERVGEKYIYQVPESANELQIAKTYDKNVPEIPGAAPGTGHSRAFEVGWRAAEKFHQIG